MALPKCKISKQRGRSRFANWKAATPTLTECPQCHELKASHRMCPNCGYYNKKQIVAVKEGK